MTDSSISRRTFVGSALAAAAAAPMMAGASSVRGEDKIIASENSQEDRMSSIKGPLDLGFVGDLMVNRDNPHEAMEKVAGLLNSPDIMFGNMECVYTDDPHMAPTAGAPVFPPAHNMSALTDSGFDVLSLANNHTVDAGHKALIENLKTLKEIGIATCGAGATISEARRPAIIERNGKKIAFLAYASMFPIGYEARSNVPGIAPLRSYDHYRPAVGIDLNYAPGVPQVAHTIFDDNDVQAFYQDIAASRKECDLLVASFHWGDFLKAYHLTEHERRLARMSIDAGVDIVAGHHHHMLRGMEFYRGKPIMYGLGHFVFDVDLQLSEEVKRMLEASSEEEKEGVYTVKPRKGWPLLPFHPDGRLTAFTRISIENGNIEVDVVPCRLRPDGRVEAVNSDSKEGREVVDYLAIPLYHRC